MYVGSAFLHDWEVPTFNRGQLQGRKRERVSGWDKVKDSEGKSSVFKLK